MVGFFFEASNSVWIFFSWGENTLRCLKLGALSQMMPKELMVLLGISFSFSFYDLAFNIDCLVKIESN